MRRRVQGRPAGAAPEPAAPAPTAAAPHYVSDYRRHVQTLSAQHPHDEAMSLAVGGSDAEIGPVERATVLAAGLRPDTDLVDVGCGSGRLAAYLVDDLTAGSYLGTDVVPELLEHARTRVPASWRFEVVEDLVIPAPDASADMVAMFSVLTHLKHEESYTLLQEARRVLRPGGVVVASFLEFAVRDHWDVFEYMLAARTTAPHLNQFVEAATFRVWADRLGLDVDRIASPPEALAPGVPLLGQSIIVLRRPEDAPA